MVGARMVWGATGHFETSFRRVRAIHAVVRPVLHPLKAAAPHCRDPVATAGPTVVSTRWARTALLGMCALRGHTFGQRNVRHSLYSLSSWFRPSGYKGVIAVVVWGIARGRVIALAGAVDTNGRGRGGRLSLSLSLSCVYVCARGGGGEGEQLTAAH